MDRPLLVMVLMATEVRLVMHLSQVTRVTQVMVRKSVTAPQVLRLLVTQDTDLLWAHMVHINPIQGWAADMAHGRQANTAFQV